MPRLIQSSVLFFIILAGCASPERDAVDLPPETPEAISADVLLDQELSQILAYADSIEARLRPVPLLTPSQAAAFNRFRNPQHLDYL